nr:XisI protein [Desmonostoc muscorum]
MYLLLENNRSIAGYTKALEFRNGKSFGRVTEEGYGCVLHLDIKNEKIWIQHDGTEGGIADELTNRGVPKQDIVLAFHSPFKRQFTEFAVG